MLTFWGRLSEYKNWEITFFHLYRSFKDGLTIVNIDINNDWYVGDHNPKFEFSIILFNMTVVEFSIYDTRHEEDTVPPENGSVNIDKKEDQ